MICLKQPFDVGAMRLGLCAECFRQNFCKDMLWSRLALHPQRLIREPNLHRWRIAGIFTSYSR